MTRIILFIQKLRMIRYNKVKQKNFTGLIGNKQVSNSPIL